MSNCWQESTHPADDGPEFEKHSDASKDEHSHSELPPADATKIPWLVAVNPQTPPAVLAALAREAATSLLERIAENPRTAPDTLSDLAMHREAEVRAAVAENQNTPEDSLWRLVRDESPDVRYVLAENYHLPIDILELLARDDNPYVAFRARKTLNRLMPAGLVEGSFIRVDEKIGRQ